jgi:hypothetical protein
LRRTVAEMRQAVAHLERGSLWTTVCGAAQLPSQLEEEKRYARFDAAMAAALSQDH